MTSNAGRGRRRAFLKSGGVRCYRMSLFGKDIKSMDNLFTHTLRDIYYAENQILKALPEMVQKASLLSFRGLTEEYRTENEARIEFT